MTTSQIQAKQRQLKLVERELDTAESFPDMFSDAKLHLLQTMKENLNEQLKQIDCKNCGRELLGSYEVETGVCDSCQ